jgi:hypothetical protein
MTSGSADAGDGRRFAGDLAGDGIPSYGARFGTGFEPGERGRQRGARQGLVDGGGVAEMTCAKDGRTGGRTLAGEGVAASVCCFWASGCFSRCTCASNEGRAG